MAHFSASFDCCPSVKNILLLDSEGRRIAVKYFSDDWPTNGAKLGFEKNVFIKTLKTNALTEAEIALVENNIVAYKFVKDLHLFVTGGQHLLRNNVDKREALENLDLIFLCVDEIVDQGIILEMDGSVIAEKVAIHSMEDSGATLTEQTLSQALATATEHITKTLLK